MNIIKQVSLFLMVFSLVVTLSACGSKGDLYHASEPRADQNDKEKSNKEINEETKKKTQ